MNDFFEREFNHAVLRDMMTHDEEGMFYLFCYEQSACGFDDVMAGIMLEESFLAVLAELEAIFGQVVN